MLSDFIAGVEAINTGQRHEMADMATDQLGGDVTGKKIAVLGAAFKPGTDDTRNSPALTVATDLARRGATIVVFDPQATVHWPGIAQAGSVEETLAGADLVLHLTEWPEFRQLDPAALGALVQNRIIIDGRLKLHPPTWQDAGWKVVQMGRAGTL